MPRTTRISHPTSKPKRYLYPLSNTVEDPVNQLWADPASGFIPSGGYRFRSNRGIITKKPIQYTTYLFANNTTFNDPDIALWNTRSFVYTAYMFYNSEFNQDIGNWDVSAVTNMSGMFYNATEFNQDLRWWDVSKVTDTTSFNDGTPTAWTQLPLFGQTFNHYPLTNTASDPTNSTWRINYALEYRFKPYDGIYTLPDTLITDMNSMFANNATFNDPDIGSWNVSSVTSMIGMFENATAFNQNIGDWNVSSVTSMSSMFAGAEAFNQDLRWWTVNQIGTEPLYFSSGTSADWTQLPFFGQTFNYYPLTNTASDPTYVESDPRYIDWRDNYAPEYRFKPNDGIYTLPDEPITNMNSMFRNNTTFNDPDIADWDVSSVTDMSSMFSSAQSFNQPIGDWNTGSVTDMSSMFYNARAFDQNIGGWNTELVTNMREMFAYARAFNQNIGGWNTGSVTNMESMFVAAEVFNQPIGGWNTELVTNMNQMFAHAKSFNQPIGDWNTGSVIYMAGMFSGARDFNQNIGGWNTGSVTIMISMFLNASNFNQPIGGWNTSSVEQMPAMFLGAERFNQPIGSWNTSSVIVMDAMFLAAVQFNQPLNSWCVSKINQEPRDFAPHMLPWFKPVWGTCP